MTIQTTYTQARANVAELLTSASDDREVSIIQRRGADDVALIAADELQSLLETAHLLRSPANAERLLTTLARVQQRVIVPQTIDQLRAEVGLAQIEKHKPAALASERRESVFQPEFREDLRFWVETNQRVALKVLDLVAAVLRARFGGLGKPEPLQYHGPGVWSRRLTEKHRLVCVVVDDQVDFVQCRYHY